MFIYISNLKHFDKFAYTSKYLNKYPNTDYLSVIWQHKK